MIHIDNIPIIPGSIPPDVNSDDEEFDCGPPDPHDLGDGEDPDNGGSPSGARPTDLLERFMLELDDLAIMNGPNISASLDAQPVPQRWQVPSMAMQEAVEICYIMRYITYYIRLYIIFNNWCVCLGGTRTALKGRRPNRFHQERAYPDGLEEDECSGHQGSHPGCVAQQRI
jgi:hypothetical protein